MWEARNRRSSNRRLEARLRAARPEAGEELIRSIAGRIEPRRQPRAWSRVAFAAAFTTLLVGMFASFGGISYAASGASNAVHTLAKLTTTKRVVVDRSSAADQYNPGNQGPGPASQTQGEQSTQAAPAAAVVLASDTPST